MRYLVIIYILLFAAGSVAFSAPAESERGAALYSRHCASCHGPLASTDKPNRPSGRIASAIRVLPSMYSLKFLSRSELDEIATALANPLP